MKSTKNHPLNPFYLYFDPLKLSLGFIIFVFAAGQSSAQKKVLRKDFSIELSKHRIVLGPCEKDSIQVKIIRSGFFQNLPIRLSIKGHMPPGITTEIRQPTPDKPGKIIFSADTNMPEGDCHLIVQGTSLNSIITTRGSVMKLSSRIK